MPISRVTPLILLLAGSASAQPAGPPAPVAEKTTPAGQAIALYRQEHAPHAPPKPCRRTAGDDITVCGTPDGASPYRVPLPEERGPRAGPKTATGEVPRMGVGGSPVALAPGVGLTLTVPIGGKGRRTTLSGNGDR